jgi:pilus assembly protein CpaE
MVEVRNNGVPLIEQAPKAAITQSVIALAEALNGDRKAGAEEAVDSGKSSVSRWLNIWPGKQRTPTAK